MSRKRKQDVLDEQESTVDAAQQIVLLKQEISTLQTLAQRQHALLKSEHSEQQQQQQQQNRKHKQHNRKQKQQQQQKQPKSQQLKQQFDAATLQQVQSISGTTADQARAALQVAFGNAEKAIQYIFDPSIVGHANWKKQCSTAGVNVKLVGTPLADPMSLLDCTGQ